MLVPHPWSRVATVAADSGSVRAAIGGLKLQDPSLQQPRQWTKERLLAVLALHTPQYPPAPFPPCLTCVLLIKPIP